MVARARKHNESFENYRENLKTEAFKLEMRLKGRMSHLSISFIKDKVRGLLRRTSTFNAGRNAEKRKKATMQYARRG